jgi:hypothetical protein
MSLTIDEAVDDAQVVSRVGAQPARSLLAVTFAWVQMNHFPRAVNKVVTEPPDPISYNRVAQYELEGEDNARQPFPPEVIF